MWQNYLRIETHTKEMCELYTATKSNMSAVMYYCLLPTVVMYKKHSKETVVETL
jgi:hypothetical protein